MESFKIFEKIEIDYIGPINNKMILTGIDYFIRYGLAKVVNSKETVKNNIIYKFKLY